MKTRRQTTPKNLVHCFQRLFATVLSKNQKKRGHVRQDRPKKLLQCTFGHQDGHGEGPTRTFFTSMKSTYTTMNRYTHPAHSRMHDGHSSKHVQPVTVPHTNAFPVFSRRFFCWFPEYWVKIATCFKKVVVPSHDQRRSNEHQHMPSNAPQKRSPVFPWVIRDCFVDALKKRRSS